MSAEDLWVLPNRAGFMSWIKDVSYREPPFQANLLAPQKLMYTLFHPKSPLHGIVLVHSTGAGKTCSAIAAMSSWLTIKSRPIVMSPVSLIDSFKEQFISSCGISPYAINRSGWYAVDTIDQIHARFREFFDASSLTFPLTIPGVMASGDAKGTRVNKPSETDLETARGVASRAIDRDVEFVGYNGLNKKRIGKLRDPDYYRNRVVIIDEAHNLANTSMDEASAVSEIYSALMDAENCKIIMMTATPVVNTIRDIIPLANLAAGPIRSYTFDYDGGVRTFVEKIKGMSIAHRIDEMFEVGRDKIRLRFLPQNFEWAVDDGGVSIRHASWGGLGAIQQLRATIEGKRIHVSAESVLPTDESFDSFFIDKATRLPKNRDLFQRQISGLFSYYDVDPKETPGYPDLREPRVIKTVMTDDHAAQYMERRKEEIKIEKSGTSIMRALTRGSCNFAPPPDVSLAELESRPDLISGKKLESLSPKTLRLIRELDARSDLRHIVFSEFREAGGTETISLCMRAAGYKEIKIGKTIKVLDPIGTVKHNGRYFVHMEEDKKGAVDAFNGNWERLSPPSRSILMNVMKESGAKTPRDLIHVCLFTRSGATGLSFKAVNVCHIFESNWTYSMMRQAWGRAARTGSHIDMPEELRYVDVLIYTITFSKEQIAKVRQTIVSQDDETLTADEHVLRVAIRKERIMRIVGKMIHASSVDCGRFDGVYDTCNMRSDVPVQDIIQRAWDYYKNLESLS